MMNKKKKIFDGDNIDLVLIIKKIFNHKNEIIKQTLIISLIGIIFSLSIANKFESSSTFYPHYEKFDKSGGDISSLAGLAGINLDNNKSDDVPPNLYPQIINSISFKQELLEKNVIKDNFSLSYRDYLIKELNKELLYNLKKIPSLILNKKDKVFNYENLIYISNQDYEIYKLLDEKIRLSLNEKDGFIKLSVFDSNPEVAAVIALEAKNILQKNIIEFKIKNANELYDFTSNQLIEAKQNLYNIQDSLANFKDSNRSIKSDLFLNKLARLETEVNIATNIYNDLALTKEKTAIDVKKNTPIFTTLNSVFVPNKKYSPNRPGIVLLFTFFGFLISCSFIIIKNKINL